MAAGPIGPWTAGPRRSGSTGYPLISAVRERFHKGFHVGVGYLQLHTQLWDYVVADPAYATFPTYPWWAR